MRIIALFLAAILAACNGGSSPPAPSGQLFQNPVFAAWSKDTPLKRGLGLGSREEQRGDIDTADHWVGKDTVSPASYLIASKDPAGMRYDIHPGVAGEAFYVRQYIGNPNSFYGKKVRLTATFTCSPTITAVWWYLHFRWNADEEDNPGVTILSESGSVASGVHTADVLMPPSNPKYKLDASAGFVPTLIISTGGLAPDWCVIHSMSAIEIP